jgi:hypothetical protein
MKILLIDSLFQRRDPAQTDMYVLMSAKHKLITDNDILMHLIKQDYDVIWLGIYHHRMTIDWDQVLRLNTKPVIVDQADNEEFVQSGIKYHGDVTVLSRYLPNENLSKHCKKNRYALKYLPWYINSKRFKIQEKTCDVAFICTMHPDRENMKEAIILNCKKNGHTFVIGEYWGEEYATLLAKCRNSIIECSRKCLTQKYIEAALVNTNLIGDVPLYPANDLIVGGGIGSDAIRHNHEYVLSTFANKDYFFNHLNQIL